MEIIAKPERKPSADAKDGLLHEYNALTNEIHQTQQQRMQIISFTVGAVGVIASIAGGVVLGSESLVPQRRLLVSLGSGLAIHTILISSLIMMISTHQAVQRLGNYIRVFIEPRVWGLNWQTHWHMMQDKHKLRGLYRLGIIYLFLIIFSWFLPVYGIGQYLPEHWLVWEWMLLIVLILSSAVAGWLTYDLHKGRSQGWKSIDWEVHAKANHVQWKSNE